MKKGFFVTLFDFSFTSFITPKIVVVLYVLGVIFGAGSFLVYAGIGFTMPGSYGVLMLIPALILSFLTIVFARVWSELAMVVFRVYDRVSSNAGSTAGPQPGATSPVVPFERRTSGAAAVADALSSGDAVEKLTRLKALLDAGTITREDFERAKVRALAA